jgi:hypothetical protein
MRATAIGAVSMLAVLLLTTACYAAVDDTLLASLGKISEQPLPGQYLVTVMNPFVSRMDATKVSVNWLSMLGLPPGTKAELGLVLGYCEYVQRTGDRSVLIVAAMSSSDSFSVQKWITAVSVGTTTFYPGVPVLAYASSSCSMSSSSFTCLSSQLFVFAIPLGEGFFSTLTSGVSRLVIVQTRDGNVIFGDAPEIAAYVSLINGL